MEDLVMLTLLGVVQCWVVALCRQLFPMAGVLLYRVLLLQVHHIEMKVVISSMWADIPYGESSSIVLMVRRMERTCLLVPYYSWLFTEYQVFFLQRGTAPVKGAVLFI